MQSALEDAMGELLFGPALGVEQREAWLARHALPSDDRAALAADFERLLVYRGLVRNTLRGAIVLALPRVVARLGALFDEYFEQFLAEQGPRTHYLRDVTSELLDFCAPLWACDTRVPPWALDLARHEALQIVVSSEREPVVGRELGELDLEQGLAFVEAARVARYDFAIHQLSSDEADRTAPEPLPTALFAYRDPEHDVRYLELTPLAASFLERLLARSSLRDALLGACAELGQDPAAALEGTARLLADLAARGALLGAAPPHPASDTLPPSPESSTMARSSRQKEPHERS